MAFDDAHLDDTISAISTPMGRSGIGIVRLSGAASLPITEQLFHPRDQAPLSPNQARLGEIRDPQSGELLDEAVVTFFKGPRSYTGEDLVELSCHGSPVILRRVLELTRQLGARMARPGEFTLRAFLNGRIDLTQAEAVRDLIDAETAYQAKVAARQLQGSLSKQLQPMKESLVDMIVHLETAVEFVDDDVMPEGIEPIATKLDRLLAQLGEIEHSFGLGRVVREGIQLAIIGRPNVGKSSVFNNLLQRDRAIVTDVPGTTRDTLSDAVSIEGLPVHLVDTAGIRKAMDVVERLGIERTRTAMADADIVLLVLDGSEDLTDDDVIILNETQSTPRLIIINKIDLPAKLMADQIGSTVPESAWVRISALTGEGVDVLRRKVVEVVTSRSRIGTEDVILTNSRHHDLIVRTIRALKEARRALDEGYTEEVILVGLHDALKLLGEITGETTIEDILGQIFSTFCIGK
jgi:tRNA modification GTPase